MSSIRNTALLYRPSLSIWTARKLDRSQSDKVNADAGAVQGAANVHKQLLPDCAELEAVKKWGTKFREFVYLRTSPWDDSGWRVGVAAHHLDFMAEAGDLLREGDTLVDDLMTVYKKAVADAQFKLNHMFNPLDYPTEAEARSKFSFRIDVQTLPDAEDFRIIEGVPPEEVEQLIASTTSSVEAKVQAAMAEAYGRLQKVVEKMATTLYQYGNKEVKRFNDTLVGNIIELCEVMPALNLTGDPALDALTAQAKQLTQYSLVDLRQNEEVRNAAIEEARQLAAVMRGDVTATVETVETVEGAVSATDTASLFADMLRV